MKQNAFIHNLHFLILEDDLLWEPIWRRILKKVDSQASYEWATSFNEAVALIERSMKASPRFDLIVADIFVSGSLTGLDLLERFGSKLQNRVLFVSAVDKRKLKAHLGPKARFVFLQKPFSDRDALSAIQALLSRQVRFTAERGLYEQ